MEAPTNEPKSAEPPAKPTAPESYTAFTAPEGRTVDPKIVERATPVFKELGLDQANAQKLVDLWNGMAQDQADLAVKAVDSQREAWRAEVTKDPELGAKLDAVKTDIGRMKDAIFNGDAALRKAFDHAMDLTGAGDNPAIIKAWWKASQQFTEGSHVSGSGPSPHGQAPSPAPRPSAAQSIYPHLPSVSRAS